MKHYTMALLCAAFFSLFPLTESHAQLICTNNGEPACTTDADCMFCEHPAAAVPVIGQACATDTDCESPDIGWCLGGNREADPCSANNDCVPNGGPNEGLCILATCTDIGSCLPQLAVEMTYFSAMTGSDGQIWLDWQTSSETNNAGFQIQLSLDNQIFVPIDFVDGFGTTEEEQNYSFKLSPEAFGVHYIRLMQVDFDGAYEYSDVVEVATDVPGNIKMYPNYPNPFNPSTKIQFVVSESLETSVKIYDSMGQEVATLFQGTPEAGGNQIVEFDGANLSSGTYYVKLITAVGSEIRAISLTK